MTISEKMQTIAENEERVYMAGMRIGEDTGYQHGHANGTAEEAERCAMKHFVTVVEGDGSDTLAFSLPFEPDVLTVWGADPRISAEANVVAYVTMDLTSFAYISAVFGLFNTRGSITTTPMAATGLSSRYSYRDGNVALYDLRSATSNPETVFPSGVPYVICAGKYTDKTMAERIRAFVLSLTGSGTASMSKLRVNAALSEEEWQALIAERPDWTFTLS